MSNYAFGKKVSLGYEEARTKVTAELAKVGFGVLTEIDVAATMKKKINVDMPPYCILGACNPQFAIKALTVEPQIGALLPCNVVVRNDAAGQTWVEFMDPSAILGLVNRPEIAPLAGEVRDRLKQVLDAI
ncbi:MAG: DUF302 domain-containing protein [Burkholderiales bacterium]